MKRHPASHVLTALLFSHRACESLDGLSFLLTEGLFHRVRPYEPE